MLSRHSGSFWRAGPFSFSGTDFGTELGPRTGLCTCGTLGPPALPLAQMGSEPGFLRPGFSCAPSATNQQWPLSTLRWPDTWSTWSVRPVGCASQDTGPGSVQALIPGAPLQGASLPVQAQPAASQCPMGPPVFSWSMWPRPQTRGRQDSSLWLSGCLTRRERKGKAEGRWEPRGNPPSPRARGKNQLIGPPPPNPPRTLQRPAQRGRHLLGMPKAARGQGPDRGRAAEKGPSPPLTH